MPFLPLDDRVPIPRTQRECQKALRFAQIHKAPKTYSTGIHRLKQYLERESAKVRGVKDPT